MDYRTITAARNTSDTGETAQPLSREQLAGELQRQADALRDQASCAAELWLADQYETTARLL